MIEIIPAIDIIDGKCVRLFQGDFAQKKVYSENPLEVAKSFEKAGLRRLHIVDLDGARRGTPANIRVLEQIANETELTIDFGGGIKSEGDLKAVFSAGAAMANIGSIAATSPPTLTAWLEQFGANRFLIGADVREEKITINGWQTTTDIEITDFLADWENKGISSFFITDVAKDGLMAGPSIDLYRSLVGEFPDLKLIASGGVRNLDDIRELEEIGMSGVIVGKAIYEGKIDVSELAAIGETANAG